MTAILTELGALGWGLAVMRRFSTTPGGLLHVAIAWLLGTATELLVLYGLAAAPGFRPTAAVGLTVAGLMALAFVAIAERSRWQAAMRMMRPHWTPRRLALVAIVALPVAVLVLRGLVLVPTGYDGLGIWVSKASLLVQGEGLRDEAFTDPARINPHRGYPIGFPLLISRASAWTGRVDLRQVSHGLLLHGLALLGVLTTLVSRRVGWTRALIGAAFLLWTARWVRGSFGYHLTSGFVDPFIGLVVGCAAAALALWLVERDRAMLHALAASVWIASTMKNEGLAWALLLVVTAAVASSVSTRPTAMKDWGLVIAPVVALGLARLAHLHLPSTADISAPDAAASGALLESGLTVLRTVPLQLVTQYPAMMIPVVVVGAALIAALVTSRRRDLMALALAPIGWLFITAGVLVLVEHQVGGVEHWIGNMLSRLIDQAIPATLVLALTLPQPRDS